jgi:hypothetical protein
MKCDVSEKVTVNIQERTCNEISGNTFLNAIYFPSHIQALQTEIMSSLAPRA